MNKIFCNYDENVHSSNRKITQLHWHEKLHEQV